MTRVDVDRQSFLDDDVQELKDRHHHRYHHLEYLNQVRFRYLDDVADDGDCRELLCHSRSDEDNHRIRTIYAEVMEDSLKKMNRTMMKVEDY